MQPSEFRNISYANEVGGFVLFFYRLWRRYFFAVLAKTWSVIWNIYQELRIRIIPGMSGLHKSNSPNTQPTAHISTAHSCCREPSKSSGLRYHNVTTTGVIGLLGSPAVLASPKSAKIVNKMNDKSLKINQINR